MLFKTLDHIRTKPKPVRQQYAFLVALLVTGLVAGVWAITLPARFVVPSTVEIAESTGPFAGLWQSFKGRWSTVRENLAALPAATSTQSTDVSVENGIDMSVVTNPTTTPRVVTPPPVPVLIATTSTAKSSDTNVTSQP